jgi:hypothetical protein
MQTEENAKTFNFEISGWQIKETTGVNIQFISKKKAFKCDSLSEF